MASGVRLRPSESMSGSWYISFESKSVSVSKISVLLDRVPTPRKLSSSPRRQGPISERRLSENSEYVNPEIRETLGFLFQNGRFVKPGKAG